RTHAFVGEALGMRLVKQTSNFDMPDSYHWYWGSGDGAPGTVVTYFERPGASIVRHGPGQASHYALAVADESELESICRRLVDHGHTVSDLEDHGRFKAVSTHDPHGQRVELAIQ